MNTTMTTPDIIRLRTKLGQLAQQVDNCLNEAERTDCPEDWDAWKHAQGFEEGYLAAVEDILDVELHLLASMTV